MMNYKMLSLLLLLLVAGTTYSQKTTSLSPQKTLTPETFLSLNRVSPLGISEDGKYIIFKMSKANLKTNGYDSKYFRIPVDGGPDVEVADYSKYIRDKHLSPDDKNKIIIRNIKVKKVNAQDYHQDVAEANVKIYNSLNYRHWDVWEDGKHDHITIQSTTDKSAKPIDIMEGKPYDCPTKPFGGTDDYTWNNDGTKIIYVCKKKYGTDYTKSTNTDLYEYDLATKKTQNLTAYNKGYDTHPVFSPKGTLAWLQMKREGYESDKNDIVVRVEGKDINLTENWDGTVYGFAWSKDATTIYYNAPVNGTVQLFAVSVPKNAKERTSPKQITKGRFDITGIVGQNGNKLIVSRTDMNRAREIFSVNIKDGKMKRLTFANDIHYNKLDLPEVKKRMVKTTDGKEMLTWVIYPPNFDPKKKYPTLLYCQGGPQGALSQFYSFRWNFQLMASQGYIIVAPNRRGMPGFGVDWNEQISGDYGGQNMQDYLAAIDDVAKEDYVDKERLGCIGASYGGYSCFYLAGHHNKRFKTFIAHDGIFNWRSMYGTTEELFFVNWDLGGPYWEKDNKTAQKSYNEFNPINYVEKWDTPIMIIQGGLDFRVPIGQGLEAFQAAQLKGIKSRLLYFPEENHWVLSPQNALVWQREFYKWLQETLPQAK